MLGPRGAGCEVDVGDIGYFDGRRAGAGQRGGIDWKVRIVHCISGRIALGACGCVALAGVAGRGVHAEGARISRVAICRINGGALRVAHCARFRGREIDANRISRLQVTPVRRGRPVDRSSLADSARIVMR